MSNQEVIAFLGRQGSGKNYQSDRLIKTGYKKLSFADPLRKMACKVIGIDYEKAMRKYDELKKTPLINNLTFRNILENLGSGVREIDENFWVKGVIQGIRGTMKNIVIDDMRYPNEYLELWQFCQDHNIIFKAYLCDYHSDRYDASNTHESAALANYLVDVVGLKDLQEVKVDVIMDYARDKKLITLEEGMLDKIKEFRSGKFFGR